jgi:lysozyme
MKNKSIALTFFLFIASVITSCSGGGGGGSGNGPAVVTISPTSGSTTKAFCITITSDKTGYSIRYTQNGSDPNASSTIYTNPIPVTANSTSVHIKAAAFNNDSMLSDIKEGSWTLSYDFSGTSTLAVDPNPTIVEGIDVAQYQGAINWSSVATAGKKFVFIRATDGTTNDTTFTTNWSGAKSAGIKRGPYHFFRSNIDADDQADAFLARFTLETGDLPPVINVEDNTGALAYAQYSNALSVFISRVAAATGKMPIIYTGSSFWNSTLNGCTSFSSCPLFIAHYTAIKPTITTSWSTWRFWQYSSSGSVSGISGNVDLNKFNGTEQELSALCL